MQRKSSENANALQQSSKKSTRQLSQQASSPLKQRMEAVLKGDRRAIHEPLAHLKATYFAD